MTTQDDEADDEVAPLAEAVGLIAEAFGEQEFTAGDLAKKCDAPLSEENPIATALEATGCSAATDARRVGYWLREKRDRIAGGWKLVAGAEGRAGRRWRLRRAL